MAKNGCFFSQNLSFLASEKQLKPPPPILRVLDAKENMLYGHTERTGCESIGDRGTQITKTQFAACVYTKT